MKPRKWTYIVETDEQGRTSMTRENDGYSLFELLGFSEVLHYDLLQYLRGDTKLDEIKRVATSNSPGIRPEDVPEHD